MTNPKVRSTATFSNTDVLGQFWVTFQPSLTLHPFCFATVVDDPVHNLSTVIDASCKLDDRCFDCLTNDQLILPRFPLGLNVSLGDELLISHMVYKAILLEDDPVTYKGVFPEGV